MFFFQETIHKLEILCEVIRWAEIDKCLSVNPENAIIVISFDRQKKQRRSMIFEESLSNLNIDIPSQVLDTLS